MLVQFRCARVYVCTAWCLRVPTMVCKYVCVCVCKHVYMCVCGTHVFRYVGVELFGVGVHRPHDRTVHVLRDDELNVRLGTL